MKTNLLFLILLLAAFNISLTAQNAGDNDPTFNPNDVGFGYGDGASQAILATAIQSDGKIIIGGEFVSYNGTPTNYLARLNTDGSLDTTFVIGTGPNNYVHSVDIQIDGKIIIGGDFSSYNGTQRGRIARLNQDGSLDSLFYTSVGADITVKATAIQSDGKVIVGGGFTYFRFNPINRIVRLNTNGNLDNSFVIGTGANGFIETIAIQSDGKIIIGGKFTSYDGTPINRIARLNTDGSLDSSFVVGTGANSDVLTIAIQADGKIVIGGAFGNYNGVTRNRVARLNPDGSLDLTFIIGFGANNTVRTTTIQPDGKIIIGGVFTSYNGASINRITRLNSDGSLDTSFVGTGVVFGNSVMATSIQLDGKIIIGGIFTNYNGTPKNMIARLNANGSVDTSFLIQTGANAAVEATAIQSDGKIIIGGAFTSYYGTPLNYLARLNPDGSLDTSFVIGTVTNSNIVTIVLQSDGKIIIGGFFTNYNGTPINRIARLNTDGSLDTSFVIGTGPNSAVLSTVIQPDGKILIGGVFTSYNGTSRNYIARLNPDGSLDNSFFIVGSGANSNVETITLQSDGKIIVGGWFTSFSLTSRNYIARLNLDGSLDTSFVVGAGTNYAVLITAIQPDGKIVFGGTFTSYNGTSINRIGRLNTDGSLDTSFVVGTGVANGYVETIAIQSDGKIIIGGFFSDYNGIPRKNIACLNIDGSLDTTFIVGLGASNSEVQTISIQTDGKIIIGGKFTSYNSVGRNRVARILHCARGIGIDVQTACNSITWIDGITYTTSTTTPTFTIIGGAATGCDSLVILNLTINATSSIDVITDCDSITWIDGNTYTISTNSPTFILTNAVGCDSVVTLNLTINANSSTDVVNTCDSITWIDGNTYSSNTITPSITLTNINGCDSVVTLNLTVNNPTSSTDVVTACNSFIWIDGNTYTSSTNTPTFILTNAVGCDSVVTLNLTVNNPTSSTDVVTACNSFTWIDGNTYTSSTNTPTFILTNAIGCDSVVTLNLTLNNATSSTDMVSACDSLTWIDGNTYTSSTNTPTFILTNAIGCDSVVTLNLTINNPTSSIDMVTTCDSLTWIDGITYTTNTNTPTFTLTNINGCDSVVTLNLTVNNPTSSTDVVTTCNSFTWINGNIYTSSTNTPTFTLTNAAGCDSVVTLNLTVNNINTNITQNVNTLTATETGATYRWLDCNNSNAPINGATSQSFTPTANGDYAVEVTKNGCTDTSACINFIITGINELETSFVKIYPNPITSEFIIELVNSFPNTQLSIVSIEGKTVYSNSTINTNKLTIDASEWSKGIYVVKITDKKSSKVVKLIKQ